MSRTDPRATCQTCAFWAQAKTDAGKHEPSGQCRRNPPIADEYQPWPMSAILAWCGEHQFFTPPKPKA